MRDRVPSIQITVQTGNHESPTLDRAHLATQDQQPINVPSYTQPDDAGELSDNLVTSDIFSDTAHEDSLSEPNVQQPETPHMPTQVLAPERPRGERKRTQPFQIQPHNKTYEKIPLLLTVMHDFVHNVYNCTGNSLLLAD